MSRQRILVVVLVLAAVGLAAFLWFSPRITPVATLSGYIEGEPLYPAAPAAGTLVNLHVQRGDVVAAGAPLFGVDPVQTAAQRAETASQLAANKALAQGARIGQRPAELAQINADLNAARAVLAEAEKNYNRTIPLFEAGAASKAQVDTVTATRDRARAQVKSSEQRLQVAQLGQRNEQVQNADERVRQSQLALDALDARLDDLAPKAPAAGRIEDVFFQPGEWVNANQPVLSLIPDDRVRLRFFVPERMASLYTVGQDVKFACDSCAAGLTAKINYVSPRPEFTPPVIYSREARDRLVYMVEAMPADAKGLTPGLPIDVTPLGVPVRRAMAER